LALLVRNGRGCTRHLKIRIFWEGIYTGNVKEGTIRLAMIIDGKDVVTSGRVVRIARLRAEYYEYIEEPESFICAVKEGNGSADLFSFLQRVGDGPPRFSYHMEREAISVLHITSYEEWWKAQINDKTRNMIRRAQKKGVEIRVMAFNDEVVRAIMAIYNETPVRQGKPFSHYGKDFETLKRDHMSYVDRSDFIGAFVGTEMIGFIKLVHGQGVSNCMQIIAKIAERDKAPMNALLAKAVEICAQRKVRLLHYGLWSRRGLGDFKKHHAFERFDAYRYFLPLNLRGKVFLALRLYRKPADVLPGNVVDMLVGLRTRWNFLKFGGRQR
jgi:hypothetical protein